MIETKSKQIRNILELCLNSSEVVSYRSGNYGDHHEFEFVNHIIVFMDESCYRDKLSCSAKLSYRFYLSINGDRDYCNAYCLDPKNKVYKKELKLLQIGMLRFLEKKEERGEIPRSTSERKEGRKQIYGGFLSKLFSNDNIKELVMKEHPKITITDEHKVEISSVKIYGDDQHWVKITNIVAPIVPNHILEKIKFPRVTVVGNVLSIIDIVTWVGGGYLQYMPHSKIVKGELYIGRVMLFSDYEKYLSKIRLSVNNMRQFYAQTEKRLRAENANWKETVVI
jgi:hypothetical protein